MMVDAAADAPVDASVDDWESFAQPFFETYCLRCHHSSLPAGEMRQFAPVDLNFDDPAVIRDNGARIRRAVGEFEFMPPNNPLPTDDERDRLVAWIDAGMPGL